MESDHNLFVCAKCGADVYLSPALTPAPTVCSTCQFLDRYVAEPKEREQLRFELMGLDR